MTSSGQFQASHISQEGQNFLFVNWAISSLDTANNRVGISYSIYYHFGGSYLDVELDNCHVAINSTTVYNNGGRVHDYAGNFTVRDFFIASGSLWVPADGNGFATLQISGNITEYGGQVSSGTSGVWSLDRVPRAPYALSGAPSISNVTTTGARATSAATTDNGGSPVTSYDFHWSQDPTFATGVLSTIVSANFLDITGLPAGKTYYVQTRAINAYGGSPWSATASFTTTQTVPDAPAAPTLSGALPTQVTVAWSPPGFNGGSPITSYDVQASTTSNFSSGVIERDGVSSPYAFTGLLPSTTYYFRVRANNAQGHSAWSAASASIKTLPGLHIGNGTGWVNYVAHIGNGTAWVPLTIYVGNGSAWK